MNGDLTLILRSDLCLDLTYIEIAQEFSSSERKGLSKLFPSSVPIPPKPREAIGTTFKELEVGGVQAALQLPEGPSSLHRGGMRFGDISIASFACSQTTQSWSLWSDLDPPTTLPIVVYGLWIPLILGQATAVGLKPPSSSPTAVTWSPDPGPCLWPQWPKRGKAVCLWFSKVTTRSHVLPLASQCGWHLRSWRSSGPVVLVLGCSKIEFGEGPSG